MNNQMLNWYRHITEINHYSNTVWLLRRAIYFVLLYNTLYLLPIADLVFGTKLFSIEQIHSGPLFNFLSDQYFSELYPIFIILQITSLLLGTIGILPRINAFLIYFTTMNLFQRSIELSSGGHHIIQLFLFFNLFMDERDKLKLETKLSLLTTLFANTAVWAARIQFCFLYLASGIYKLSGALWIKGEALYYSLAVDEYSHHLAQQLLLDSTTLLMIGNYAALAYQLLFPVLIWIRKIKYPFLIMGVIFHLFVAFIIGLTDFSFMMLACYAVFIDDTISFRLRTLVKKKNHFIKYN